MEENIKKGETNLHKKIPQHKKYWYSIVLDDSVPFEDICAKIDESYEKAKK